MCVMKGIVRYAVIAGLVGGTALLAAGPETRARVGALFTQARNNVNSAIDSQISDPVALRAQLRSLAEQYPPRIAAVRGDLAELKEQVAQLNRELEVSERVMELSQVDHDQMQQLIARAQEAQAGMASYASDAPSARQVRIVFASQSLSMDQAFEKCNKIQQVHAAYGQRAADIQRDLSYLEQQETRLTSLLDQLATEHTQFQTQLFALDRQVDSIARNDRLIEVMERRQRTIDQQSRYSAASLDQIQGRLADIRARQEARLEALGTTTATTNYENRAKYDLDAKKAWAPGALPKSAKPAVVEITPETLKQESCEPKGPVAIGTR